MNKIAVIGLGNISKRHRANLKKIYPEAEIYSVSASGKQPIEVIDNSDKFFLTLDELLQHDIDMAIVASPATYHAQHAIPLLKAGVPVLVEKPLAASYADAEAIFLVAKETQTPIAVGYCLRYLSSSQKIQELLSQDLIGAIYNVSIEIGQYLPSWRPGKNYQDSVSASKKLGGGALLELSHELDYAQWMFGTLTPHSSILRSSKELNLEVEDLADILATNESGIVFSIHLDFLQRKTKRACRITGSQGSLEWNLLSNKIKVIRPNYDDLVFDENEVDRNQMYIDMLKDFERKISGLNNQCITVLEAKKTVFLIEEIKQIALKR